MAKWTKEIIPVVARLKLDCITVMLARPQSAVRTVVTTEGVAGGGAWQPTWDWQEAESSGCRILPQVPLRGFCWEVVVVVTDTGRLVLPVMRSVLEGLRWSWP